MYAHISSQRGFQPLWFISLSLLFFIIILPLVRQGMFLDGIIYAAIAKNLSLDLGNLWQPFYSKTLYPEFYEHPPMVFYLQSLFFKLFGPGFGVERFYSFLMALLQYALIAWYWVQKEKATLASLGLLLLLWLSIPLNHLYPSNMLEGTLTLFTTIASLTLLINTQSKPSVIIQNIVSAFAMLIAFLCNGPTAFFPLAIPFIRGFVDDRKTIKHGLKETLILGLYLAVILACFYLAFPNALSNTRKYFAQQLLPSLVGELQPKYIGLKHLNILLLYFRAIGPALMVSVLCIFYASKQTHQPFIKILSHQIKNKQVILFFLIGLVSSLPVGLNHRQAFNYIMQAAPFMTLTVMWLCFEPIKMLINSFHHHPSVFKAISRLSYGILALSCICVVILSKGYNRNEAMIKDIHYLIEHFKNDEIFSVSRDIYYSWYSGAYFSRFSLISLSLDEEQAYYLSLKNGSIPPNYHIVKAPLSFYTLAAKTAP